MKRSAVTRLMAMMATWMASEPVRHHADGKRPALRHALAYVMRKTRVVR